MLYKNLSINEEGHLLFAGHDTVALAKQFGTPAMLIDEDRIRTRCRTYMDAMARYLPAGSRPLYASKALSIKRLYEIMKEEGMGIDVVSPGELYTAVKAGYPMENAFFHGNSKTDFDIRFAIEHGIGWFVCDNADELDAIDAIAGEKGICQKLLLRLSPGIDPHTHEKISTGRVDCKFGVAIETGQAEELILRAAGKKNVALCGYHCHIGSQIFDHVPFCDAAIIMLKFMAEMERKHGIHADILNLGGGMAVPYTAADGSIDYAANIAAIGRLLGEQCAALGMEKPVILMEPGRSIVADAGITLYDVVSIKEIPGFKNFVAVDGGMSDNPRYALYQAEYTILPASRMNDEADFLCTVAGRCCESGDLIQEDVMLPKMRRGDLLAVLTTGAYNYSMASNYNRIPRPPVVMVNKDDVYVAVRRETLDDLMNCE
ncbi:MAG: diaminopimelate decarboxylase [Ruminococcaceae bacterium]|nr:diaminopimelate decarboxylase [Oscillospiraceae bacterium]